MIDTTETTNLNDGWIPVQTALPATDGVVSRPLLFLAGSKLYAGHYHSNGWFYNEVRGLDDELRTARGKPDTMYPEREHVRPTPSVSGLIGCWCHAWRYMR